MEGPAQTQLRNGTRFNVEFIADPGYKFVDYNITPDYLNLLYSVATPNYRYAYMPNEDVTIEPIFKKLYTVTVQQSEGGSASAAKSGVSGDRIQLTATPDAGNVLVGWQIVSGEGEIQYDSGYDRYNLIIGESDVTVAPIFEEIKKNSITLLSDGNGKVYADKAELLGGETVNIYALANEGYSFAKWQVVEGDFSFYSQDMESASFIMPNNPVVLKAVFAKNYTITVISPKGIDAGASVDTVFDGCSFELSAENKSNKVFKQWRLVSGNAVIEEPTSNYSYITVGEGDVVVEAVYQDAYRVKAVSDIAWVNVQGEVARYGRDIWSGGDAILPGERVYLSCGIDSESLMVFKEWEAIEGTVIVLENDDPELPDYTHYFIMPAENVVLNAVFEKDPAIEAYQVTVLTEGKGDAFAHSDYYAPGDTVCIYAYPDDYCVLKDIQVISGGVLLNEYDEFVMPSCDVTIKVIFERDFEDEYYRVFFVADGNLQPYSDSYDTPDGKFISLSVYDYSNTSFFKEWQIIKGNIELGEYTVEDEWAEDGYVTLYGFYMPEEDVEIHAVAMPFVHYFHDWHTECIDDEQHREYCDCGASIENWHYSDYFTLKEPTHTEEGIERHYCHDCDYIHDEPIPRIPDHLFYGNNPFCDICGATRTNENKVTFDSDTATATVKENTLDRIILPESIMDGIAGNSSLAIELREATVDLSNEALTAVKDKSGALDIQVVVSDDELLTEAQKNGVPEEYNNSEMIVVNVTARVGDEELHELGGDAKITVPFDFSRLSAGENPVVYYIADDGTATAITDVVCDRENGTVTFTTNHFSGFIISVKVSGNTVSGNFKSFGDGLNEETTVQIIKRATTELVGTATIVGNEGSYSFENVADGEYTLKVTKDNHVAREYDLTVGEENEFPDVEIWLIGDVNGDGKVNTIDVSRLLAHVRGTDSITDAYTLRVAELTEDGDVNTADVSRLFAHAQKTEPLF